MALYAVHCASGAPADLANARFVKQGFRWSAFVFAPLWLLAHRLWLAFALWLAAALAIGALSDRGALTLGADTALSLLLSLFAGFQGAQWLDARLTRDGLPEAGIAGGRTLQEAERAFFARAIERPKVPPTLAPPPHTNAPRSQDGGVIGLFPEAGR